MHNQSDLLLNLAWLIPLFPFLAFAIIPLGVYRNRKLSHGLVIGAISIAFLLSQIVLWRAVGVWSIEHTLAYESPIIHWLSSGYERFGLGIYIDPPTVVMLFVVPLICMMTFIYSVGYMNFSVQVDPRYSRFFSYLSLFAAGMLGMVIFNNLLAFFICWEILDICSYLLIGFWYEKRPDLDRITPQEAGLKAFIVTKIGDLFFILGLMLLYAEIGSLTYSVIFSHETLEQLTHTPFLGTDMATVIALLLFGGAVGKSAQFPLHVWLPDATQVPTPALALIHAATVVSAGVFLIVRTFPILQVADAGVLAFEGIPFVALIGAFTAIFASVVAVAQNDVKRGLAFSTISQLGYMVAALGIGAYVAGTFHLITHAFFKALLFLSSGSVIHGLEHGHHHAHEHHEEHEKWFDPHDMMNMGGLAKRMPRTYLAFVIGGLALSGFPILTSGFWSRDNILVQAWAGNLIVFWTLAITAGLTGFYTMRQLCLTFAGEPRTGAAQYAPESKPAITTPLLILAAFAVGLGWISIPEQLPVVGGIVPNWFHHFMLSTIAASEHVFDSTPMLIGAGLSLTGLLMGWLVYGYKPLKASEIDRIEAVMRKIRLGWLYRAAANHFYLDSLYQNGVVWAVLKLADLADWFDYGQPQKRESDGQIVLVKRHGVVDGIVHNAGRVGNLVSQAANWIDATLVDGLVNLVGATGRHVSADLDAFDLEIVGGIVNGVGEVKFLGGWIRHIQTGKVQFYLLIASVTVLVLIIGFFAIIFLPI
ncbi:MAG TPA: NADH-quinone oxidoreductase subunit L [Chloroflexi bacterium]|nr:NADH-quinone oxidoreductase subunit L [Chloroflexota bacterium]